MKNDCFEYSTPQSMAILKETNLVVYTIDILGFETNIYKTLFEKFSKAVNYQTPVIGVITEE